MFQTVLYIEHKKCHNIIFLYIYILDFPSVLAVSINLLLFLNRPISLLSGVKKPLFALETIPRQRERQKNNLFNEPKTTISLVHHTFLYISLLFTHYYDVKIPNFASNDEILFFFLNLDMIPWNSTSRGFAFKVNG